MTSPKGWSARGMWLGAVMAWDFRGPPRLWWRAWLRVEMDLIHGSGSVRKPAGPDVTGGCVVGIGDFKVGWSVRGVPDTPLGLLHNFSVNTKAEEICRMITRVGEDSNVAELVMYKNVEEKYIRDLIQSLLSE